MKKNKIILVLIPLFLLILINPVRLLIKNSVINVTGDFSGGLSTLSRKVNHFFSFIPEISKLREQNRKLSSDLISLQVDKSKIEELEYENNALKKELGYLETNKERSLIPSKIIGREPTSFLDYITIDKGHDDGIGDGMAVISSGVLIGQVKEVYNNQSKVVLVTSKDSLVLAMLQQTRDKGILRGGISGLVLEDIARDANFESGEYVVTSGLGGQLPEGILIGKANKEQSSSGELFKNISVEPIADLSKLDLVFVVKQ